MALTLTSREGTKDINAELRKLSPQVTSGIVRMRQAAYADGKVPGKYKLLTAAAISVAIRCEPCIRAYVEWAGKSGATKEELVEFLNVAMAMQGCPGEEWALKALAAYEELAEQQGAAPDPSCCTVPASE
ncbi:MAG: carboxymuconolactone decarboxylase family protein [candidate division Zixibacteria bacterium]|nr:carboxymuconolactone decarboxylase family protein [candidate division Zixibacteria bacterium]MCI0596005.1 carboxymuconolactone decarboxylase family protein [candidate division Zixibacteria bacterium]